MSKIIVDKLEIKNFLSYGNQWTEFDFNSGINVILGQNKDKDRSNGSGKSSFLEAIPFALFGKTNKDITLNEMVNWKNGKKCEVKLHFQKDGVSYIIHRGIKPGMLTLIKDGVEVPKLSDKRLFQLELENDLIGMDFKAAQSLLFQNANNMVSLFNTPKAEKRRFIEKFFNLEIYSKATEVTNKKLKGVTDNLSEVSIEVSYKQRMIDDLSEKIESFVYPELGVYEGNVSTLKDQCDTFLDNSPDLEERLENEKEKVKIFVDKRDELDKEILEHNRKLNNIRLEIRSMETEVKGHLRRVEEIGDIEEQKERLNKLRSGLEHINNLDLGLEGIRDKIYNLQERKSHTELCQNEHETKMKIAGDNLNEWKSKGVLDTPECPTCFQEADPEHIKGHIKERCDFYVSEIDGHQKMIEEGQVIIDGLDRELSESQEELKKAENLNDKKIVIEKKIAELSNISEKEREIANLQNFNRNIEEELTQEIVKEQSLVVTLEQSQQERLSVNEKIDCYQERVENLKDDISTKKELLSKFDNAQSILENQKEMSDRLLGEHKSNIDSKTQLEGEIVSIQDDVVKLQKMKDYLDHIKFTLKDENVKQYAISNIIPYLQQQTNHYLAETGHDYYVELDSWLDGEIKGYGVGECGFGNMSGGEGKSIDLALKFAMMDVARRQSGSYMDVLVLDELLDSSIDSFGLEKTMEIVRLKQHEDNLKVFIVSHREEVSAFEADRVYQVTKENGLSSLGLVDG